MKNFINKIICKLRGHDYPCLTFDNFSLCYCQRCGREVADRTFDDILPIPEDHDWFDEHLYQ